jgi:hypothetical protein
MGHTAHAGATPAHPGGRSTLVRQPRARCPWSRDWSYCYTRARRPRTQVIGHTAHAGETPAHPGGRPTLVRRPRARCPRSQNALAPVMGHTAVCGRDARAPRRYENAHHSSTSGTSRNDRATPLFATERGRPALVGQLRAYCPWFRDWSYCSRGRDARAPRRCENAHHSSTSGTSRNNRLLSRQECILSIKIWHHAVYASEYDRLSFSVIYTHLTASGSLI